MKGQVSIDKEEYDSLCGCYEDLKDIHRNKVILEKSEHERLKLIETNINHAIGEYKKTWDIVKNEKWGSKRKQQDYLNELARRWMKLEELLK